MIMDTRETELIADIEALTANRDAAVKDRNEFLRQRDELIEALEIMIIGACAVGVPHQGERKVLKDAVDHARAAIAHATGKEA